MRAPPLASDRLGISGAQKMKERTQVPVPNTSNQPPATSPQPLAPSQPRALLPQPPRRRIILRVASRIHRAAFIKILPTHLRDIVRSGQVNNRLRTLLRRYGEQFRHLNPML